MRGRHRSFALDDVVREAQLLELQGARELNLVAQDLAHYGRDLRNGTGLPGLLEALVRETDVAWLRLLYLYPTGITPPLLETVATHSRILRYIDMPIQHASDAVLARMRRPERQRTIREKVARFRDVVPDVTLRTTCIVGFPGETDADFQTLLDFLEETRFDRVGAFTYSAQEGTAAWNLADDVPEIVKRDRLERLQELQRGITSERYERHIGRTVRVLVDRASDGKEAAFARAPWQADDVDGVTRMFGPMRPGTFAEVSIDDVVDDYDFRATLLCEVPEPGRSAPLARRSPLRVLSSVGSFGR